jgi:hypothetical protein
MHVLLTVAVRVETQEPVDAVIHGEGACAVSCYVLILTSSGFRLTRLGLGSRVIVVCSC